MYCVLSMIQRCPSKICALVQTPCKHTDEAEGAGPEVPFGAKGEAAVTSLGANDIAKEREARLSAGIPATVGGAQESVKSCRCQCTSPYACLSALTVSIELADRPDRYEGLTRVFSIRTELTRRTHGRRCEPFVAEWKLIFATSFRLAEACRRHRGSSRCRERSCDRLRRQETVVAVGRTDTARDRK